MFFTKNLFSGFLAFFIIIELCCAFAGFRRKQVVARRISAVLLSVIFIQIFYLISIYTYTYKAALLLNGFYYAGYAVSIYVLFQFIFSLREKTKDDFFQKKLIQTFEAAVAIDCVVLATNVLTGIFFDIYPVTRNGLFYSWTIKSNKLFVFHFLLCYLMIFSFTISSVLNISKNSRLYNRKYITIMILYIIAIIFNSFDLFYSGKWTLDYSMFVYSAIILIAFYFYIYSNPNLEKNSILTAVTNQISDAVICLDNEDTLIYENQIAAKLREKNGAGWADKYRKNKEDTIIDTEVLEMDDGTHVFDVEFRRIRDRYGKISGSYLKLNDRTDSIMNSKTEEYRATHDELTGLYNRTYFFHSMEQSLKDFPDIPRFLVVTNIRNFKLVNDMFGTKFGDKLLISQAEMLKLANFEHVIYGRISGDKFAMLIPKVNFNFERAIKNTERVKALASELNYNLQINLGVYEISNIYENVHLMYDKANLAIKSIKDDYDQVLAMYDTSLMKKIKEEQNVVNEFYNALESRQFCMFLQPQIDCKTGKCIGAESLVRWYDEENGLRYPGDFIKILEKSGLIFELDQYIWKSAVEKLSEWKRRGFEDYYISVNISPKDFYYADIYSIFTHLVEQYGINPKKLNLEITESAVMDNRQLHLNVISKLQEYGFNIEMDDFGSGYSSLNTLKDIPMNVLKIDMEFLNATSDPERGRKIISNIVVMAKALGMQIITEGVETEEQCNFLKDAGCDIFQGFYFSRPISVADFESKYMEEK